MKLGRATSTSPSRCQFWRSPVASRLLLCLRFRVSGFSLVLGSGFGFLGVHVFAGNNKKNSNKGKKVQ